MQVFINGVHPDMSLPIKLIFSYHNLSDPSSKLKTQVIKVSKKGKDGHSKAVKEDVTVLPLLDYHV